MRPRLPKSLTAWVVLALVVVGAWAIYVGRNAKLREWAPNMAVAAFGFALTLTVVAWIVRREGQRRIAPRVDNAIYWMGLSFRIFISAVTSDYAYAHAESFREIPGDAREMFQQWLDDQDNEDVTRQRLEDGRLMLVASGQEFAKDLEERRERDLDVLEPELVRAIEDFQRAVGGAVQLCGFLRAGLLQDPEKAEHTALRSVAQGGADFAAVFEKYGPSWMEILPLMKGSADEISARRRGLS
jgi:hypothetical protein